MICVIFCPLSILCLQFCTVWLPSDEHHRIKPLSSMAWWEPSSLHLSLQSSWRWSCSGSWGMTPWVVPCPVEGSVQFGHEWGQVGWGVDSVVVSKFGYWQPFIPVILVLVHQDSQELFDLLIDHQSGCWFVGGRPWSFQNWSLNIWATPATVTLDIVGTTWAHLDSQSTTTMMVSYPWLHGNSMIRLTKIIFHPWSRTWLGMSFLTGGAGKVFIWLHRSQPLTYFATSTTPGHQKL